MVRIVKTAPRQWQGNGSGTSSASWGVQDRPEIRIRREAGLWIAIGAGVGRAAAESRQGLEQIITYKLENRS